MKNELIINGFTYRKVETPVEDNRERITGAYCHVYSHGFKQLRWSRHIDAYPDHKHKECVELVEIREGERILSMDAFAKAWDSSLEQNSDPWCVSMASTSFKKACKVLGFE